MSWETCMHIKKQQLELDMEQQTGSKLGKEYVKAVCCHLAYLTYMQKDYIMWNAGLDEAQAGIKIAGRNINNLRCADDTTLMAESKEELKSLLKVQKESEKADLKFNIQNMEIMNGILPHYFMANRWGEKGNSERLYFLGLQNHCR